MKIIKSVALLTLIATFSISNAFAERTERTTVKSVFSSSDGGAFVVLDGRRDTSGAICSSNGRYRIDSGAAGKNGLLAGALTAKASGAEVQMDVASCQVDGIINNFIVY